MVRGLKSEQVNVLHNTCTHRGAVVCGRDRGNAKALQCSYHAWSADSQGKSVGVPSGDAYGETFETRALGLAQVARTETYRGLVFASFDSHITDLVSYLAGAREYLGLVIDEADGDLQIISGTQEYGTWATGTPCWSTWRRRAARSPNGSRCLARRPRPGSSRGGPGWPPSTVRSGPGGCAT